MLLTALLAAFIAFTGVATLVPDGLADPGGATAGGGTLALGWLVVLAFDVALVALLLGYRLAVMRYGSAADAARSALTYALVIAVAAGATRAIDTPRLLGPVVLTLVFYLWDALHGTAPGAPPAAPLRGRRWSCSPRSASSSSRGTSSWPADADRRARTASRTPARLTPRAPGARNTCRDRAVSACPHAPDT